MKKGMRILLVLALVLSLACSVYAATDNFVASVTAKPAPEFIATSGTVDKPMVEVVDGENQNVESFDVQSVVITPVAQKDESHVEEEVKTALTEIYEQLSAPEVKLSEVMPKLTEVLEKVAEEDAAMKTLDVDKLVVKDLFNVSVSEELAKTLEREGNFLRLTFDPKLAENQHFFVMVCVDGQWLPVDYVRNEDGTVTCIFSKVGAVAFLVNVE